MAMAGRKTGQYQQAKRARRIVDALRSHHFGLTLDELAERCEVSEKTIRRDLEVIADWGFETFATDIEGHRRIRLRHDELQPVVLNEGERFALLAMQQVFDVLHDTPLREDVETLLGKVTGSFDQETHQRMADNRARFVYLPEGGHKTYAGKTEVLDGLWDGVLRSVCVQYRYEREGKPPREGKIEPFAMALYKQGLYVIGRDPARDEAPRVFAAERFTTADPIKGSKFKVPKDFDVRAFFDGAFGLFHGQERIEVVVHFSAEVRQLVCAREWHQEQELKDLPGGGVRLSMRVASTAQVLPWLLSWGPRARPVAPDALVKEYDEAVRGMLRGAGERAGVVSTRPTAEIERKLA